MSKRKLLVRAGGQTTQLPSSDTVAAFALGGNLVFGPKLDLNGFSTVDLMSADSNNIELQGTNGPVLSFGNGVPGAIKFVTFGTSGLVIKHTDGTIDLPGQRDITARQYDWLLAHCVASDNWRVRVYSRHDGTPVVGGGSGPASTDQLPEGSTNLYFTNTRARAAARFVWEQTSAAAVWTVPHNTNGYPSVTVVDTLGNVVAPDISYVDANTVQITHGAAYAGKAYIN